MIARPKRLHLRRHETPNPTTRCAGTRPTPNSPLPRGGPGPDGDRPGDPRGAPSRPDAEGAGTGVLHLRGGAGGLLRRSRPRTTGAIRSPGDGADADGGQAVLVGRPAG